MRLKIAYLTHLAVYQHSLLFLGGRRRRPALHERRL